MKLIDVIYFEDQIYFSRLYFKLGLVYYKIY